MKQLFIIFYTIVYTYPAPCPDSQPNFMCAVYHGEKTDTIKVEEMTIDTQKVKDILSKYPNAKIDTFLLIPYVD